MKYVYAAAASGMTAAIIHSVKYICYRYLNKSNQKEKNS